MPFLPMPLSPRLLAWVILLLALPLARSQAQPTSAADEAPGRWLPGFRNDELTGRVTDVLVRGDEVILARDRSLLRTPASERGRVIRWDGRSWADVGNGLGCEVNALAWFQEHLYAGCGASTVHGGGLYRLDGPTWTQVGAPGSVNVLTGFGNRLYVVQATQGTFYPTVLAWTGTAWERFPGLGDGSRVSSIVVDANGLVASVTAYQGGSQLMAWDGSAWRSQSTTHFGDMRWLTRHDGRLYGARFTGGTYSNAHYQLERLDGTSWVPVVQPPLPLISSLASGPGGLYATLDCLEVATTGRCDPARPVAPALMRWDGQRWVDAAGGRMRPGATFLRIEGDTIAVAGRFERIEGVPGPGYIAVRTNDTWRTFGVVENGLNQPPVRFRTVDGRLYAMGHFTDVGGDVDTDFLVVWNGTAWARTAFPPPGPVYDLVSFRGQVYASVFDERVWSQQLRRWTGAAWEALPVKGAIRALFVHNEVLHIGGSFDPTNALTRHFVQYDGTSFKEDVRLTNAGGVINDFAAYDGILYAVGLVNADINQLGKRSLYEYRNGQWWSPDLGPHKFTHLVTRPEGLYLASENHDGSVFYLARWARRMMDPVAFPAAGRTSALAGGDLGLVLGAGAYTGYFDESQWRAFGSGVAGTATAMAVLGNRVFVGGTFDSSGDGEVAMHNVGVFEIDGPVASEEVPEAPPVVGLSTPWPSPSSGNTVRSRLIVGTPDKVTVSVVDVLGRTVDVVFSGFVSSETTVDVDVSRLAPGVYRLRAEGAHTRSSRAFVVR